MIDNTTLGKDVSIPLKDLVNIYGCSIGDNTKIGPFVEIQKGAHIGKNCKVQSHAFICEGVTIEDEVFISHGVCFVNDRIPRAANKGSLKTDGDWKLENTLVKKGASIGSNATIMSGITIGEHALIGAGSVVTKDVAACSVVVGNPAKLLKQYDNYEDMVKGKEKSEHE